MATNPQLRHSVYGHSTARSATDRVVLSLYYYSEMAKQRNDLCCAAESFSKDHPQMHACLFCSAALSPPAPTLKSINRIAMPI